jgi:hypothetical protein
MPLCPVPKPSAAGLMNAEIRSVPLLSYTS